MLNGAKDAAVISLTMRVADEGPKIIQLRPPKGNKHDGMFIK